MPATPALSHTRGTLVALCVGLSVVGILPQLPGPAVAVCCVVSAALIGLIRPAAAPLAAALLLGLGWSLLQAEAKLSRRLPGECVRVPLLVTGVVASLPRQTDLASGRRQRFEVAVSAIEPAACAGPRRVLLSYYGDASLQPGDDWIFHARLRRPWGFENAGSFNIQGWFAESGIDAVGSTGAVVPGTAQATAWRYLHHRLRQRLATQIAAAGLSGPGSAVIRAITVADKSGIDRDLWEQMQAWGLNHLLVVSGLHVGMLAGAVLLMLRVTIPLAGYRAKAERAALGLALVAATGYTALAGFSVATTRALIMLAAVLITRGLGRRGRAANALLPALAVILMVNPLATLGSGLWLSFVAVASLLWLSLWQARNHPVAGAMRAHLFLALVMLPLGAAFFGGASLVSAPANLVAVPLFALWVVPLALVGVLFALAGLDAAAWCWQLAAAPVEFGLLLTAQSGHHYLGVTGRWYTIVLAALGVGTLAAPLSPWWRCLALLLLLPLVLPARPAGEETRVTVLDVGQGTAVVVQQGARALLYDTGGGDPAGANIARSVVLPYLRSRGITALQDLVISHGDLDHAAGLDSVRVALPVLRLWMGGEDALPQAARPCRAGQAWSWAGGPRFRFLSPAAAQGLSGNDASCVLMVDTGRGRVLLAGDISQPQEFQLLRYWRQALAADVLLVGHHGSATSTAQAWLNHVDPTLAIHSAGYGNRFGHPHPRVQARLAAHGVRQHMTWQQGALEVAFPDTAFPQPAVDAARAKTWWK